jgi:transglutaminase-like putative cysteine protease
MRFISTALIYFLFFFRMLCLADEALQQNSYKIETAGSWVDNLPLEINEASNKQNSDGVIFNLIDEQVAVSKSELYSRYIKEVVNENGVQNESKLEFSFDPSYEELIIHSIKVHRGTNSFDRLDPQKIKILQQEKDLQRHVYDGRLSIVTFLEDIRVGDIIEYSSTIRGVHPSFVGHYVDSFYVQWDVPVKRQRIRVLYPSDRPFFSKSHNINVEPLIRDKGPEKEYIWEFTNLPKQNWDGDLPTWYHPTPWIQMSDFADWGDVLKWGLKQYEISWETSPAITEQVNQWKQQYSVDEERFLAALRFVQDEVRYLGIELGPHSFQPTHPSIVISRRFGDCKDKSLLLCFLLKEMGISASPVLVNTSYRQTVSDWLPSPLAFDHVIVRAQLGGQEYWVDSTRSFQRGPLQKNYISNFGKGLVVKDDSTSLTTIPPSTSGLPLITVKESYTLPSYDEPVQLQIDSTFEGSQADDLRSDLSSTGQSEFEKNYLNYYARIFPHTSSSSPIQINDDPKTNIIKIKELYKISDFWSLSENKKEWCASFGTLSSSDLIRKPKITLRKMPWGISYPFQRIHTVEVNFPADMEIDDEGKVIEDKAFRFDYSAKYSKRKLTINYNYKSLMDSVNVEDIPSHLKKVDAIAELLDFPIVRPTKVLAIDHSWHPNWNIIFTFLMALVLLSIAGVKIYKYQPADQFFNSDTEINPELDGVKGWLIVVMIGLGIGSIRCGYFIIQHFSAYSLDTWQLLTMPSSESYHGLWAPLLTMELLGNLTTSLWSALLIVLLVKKRKIFPILFICFLISNIIFISADHFLGKLIPAVAQEGSSNKELFRSFYSGLIWILYCIKSKRVKATFRY